MVCLADADLLFTVQTKMVDQSLLSAAEIKWLNDYHQQVWEKVSLYVILSSLMPLAYGFLYLTNVHLFHRFHPFWRMMVLLVNGFGTTQDPYRCSELLIFFRFFSSIALSVL